MKKAMTERERRERMREYKRKWAQNHREQVREAHRRYIESLGPESISDYQRSYYIEHRAEIAKADHARYMANRQRILERNRIYLSNPEAAAKRRAYRLARAAAIRAGTWRPKHQAPVMRYSVTALGHGMTVYATSCNAARSKAAKTWGVPYQSVRATRFFT